MRIYINSDKLIIYLLNNISVKEKENSQESR